MKGFDGAKSSLDLPVRPGREGTQQQPQERGHCEQADKTGIVSFQHQSMSQRV